MIEKGGIKWSDSLVDEKPRSLGEAWWSLGSSFKENSRYESTKSTLAGVGSAIASNGFSKTFEHKPPEWSASTNQLGNQSFP